MIPFHIIWLVTAPLGVALAGTPPSCSPHIPLSCHNTSVIQNTCCFIAHGQLLQTQFWDYKPAVGPPDSWTIHGLWPDNCDGSYPKYCYHPIQYPSITEALIEAGAHAALEYMQEFWKSDRGNDDEFWMREWVKHGTCISTLQPKCYHNYYAAQEVADFFKRAIGLFQELPTYEWLAEAGIVPSRSKRYLLDDVQSALEEHHGAPVTLRCQGNKLHEVWYHYNVKGSLQSGEFVSAVPDGIKGKECPERIRYEPKTYYLKDAASPHANSEDEYL